VVKIDPQSIGVGQYQHDLSEQKLSRSLDAVVEDCVNAVGVDVNPASTPLLSRVSGIGEGLARSIVSYREAHGPFRTRAVLKKVPRLGPKAFELSAGLRPVVLEPAAWPTWLGEEPADAPHLKALLAPYPSEEMVAWPVSPRVGNVKNNDPSLIEPIAGAG